MKNFLEHLAQAQKTYEFRIKVANIDPSDSMDRLESALNAYGLESITKPKRIPIAENVLDFPSFGPTEVFIVDAVLKYPVNDAQLRQLLGERWCVPVANIVVIPRNHPELLWRENEGELREYKQGEAVLDKPLEDNPEGKEAGKKYAEAGALLRELSKAKFEIEGSEKADSKTTNDIAVGTTSPVKGR